MPIPKPKGSEDEKDFINRCMSVLADEYEDNAQRYAICINQFEQRVGMSFLKYQYAKKNNPAKIASAIKNIDLKFAEGVPHYTKDGKLYTGPTHKGPDGKLMTGAVHGPDSEYLYHKEDLATK